MSVLLRLARPQSLQKGLTFLASKRLTSRSIATSPKKNETQTKEELYPTKQTWSSYGFDYNDKFMDRHTMHVTLFVTVSICLVYGVLYVAYAPDVDLKDWARREAYLQIRYREEHGLPLVDPNLIDPEKVILPTEEELLGTEIIV